MTTTIEGKKWQLIMAGVTSFRYDIRGDTVHYTVTSFTGRVTLEIGGVYQRDASQKDTSEMRPDTYVCEGDALRLTTPNTQVVLSRVRP